MKPQWVALRQHKEYGKGSKPFLFERKVCLLWILVFLFGKDLLCFVMTNTKIAHYMLSYHIIDLPDGSIKVLIRKAWAVGEIGPLASLASQICITYVTQKSMKGQVIIDHLVLQLKDTNPWSIFGWINIEPEEEHSNWEMYSDEAVNIQVNRIRAIMISPAWTHYPMIVKLKFP